MGVYSTIEVPSLYFGRERRREAKKFDYGYKPINISVPSAFRMFVT